MAFERTGFDIKTGLSFNSRHICKHLEGIGRHTTVGTCISFVIFGSTSRLKMFKHNYVTYECCLVRGLYFAVLADLNVSTL